VAAAMLRNSTLPQAPDSDASVPSGGTCVSTPVRVTTIFTVFLAIVTFHLISLVFLRTWGIHLVTLGRFFVARCCSCVCAWARTSPSLPPTKPKVINTCPCHTRSR
jgi:hypothetical protein